MSWRNALICSRSRCLSCSSLVASPSKAPGFTFGFSASIGEHFKKRHWFNQPVDLPKCVHSADCPPSDGLSPSSPGTSDPSRPEVFPSLNCPAMSSPTPSFCSDSPLVPSSSPPLFWHCRQGSGNLKRSIGPWLIGKDCHFSWWSHWRLWKLYRCLLEIDPNNHVASLLKYGLVISRNK